jgi:hypothetical protein
MSLWLLGRCRYPSGGVSNIRPALFSLCLFGYFSVISIIYLAGGGVARLGHPAAQNGGDPLCRRPVRQVGLEEDRAPRLGSECGQVVLGHAQLAPHRATLRLNLFREMEENIEITYYRSRD